MTGKEAETGTGTGVDGVQLDKLLTRGGGGLALAAMFWMNSTLVDMQQEIKAVTSQITKVTAELDIVSPKDVLRRVQELQSKIIERGEFGDMMKLYAPWSDERPEIIARLKSIEERLNRLEDKSGD